VLDCWYFLVPVRILLQDGALIINDLLEPVNAVYFPDRALPKRKFLQRQLTQKRRQFLDGIVADVQLNQTQAVGQVGQENYFILGNV